MALHTTVVYYSKDVPKLKAFHVSHVNRVSLQEAFDEHNVHILFCIAIETDTVGSRDFKTIFTESEIKEFLESWEIDFL